MALVQAQHSHPVHPDHLGSIPTAHLHELAEEQPTVAALKCQCHDPDCGGGMRLTAWTGEQLLCGALIEHALKDALQTRKGEPTMSAKWARAWFAASPVNPHGTEWEQVRYPGSFQWCADALSLDGFNMGRPLLPIAEWRSRWIAQIDRVWGAALEKNRPRRPCFARHPHGKLCQRSALPGSLFCRDHQAASLPAFAPAPAEPEDVPEPQPECSARRTVSETPATPWPRAQAIVDDDLPDVLEGEAYLRYHAWCRRIGVTPATPLMWGALQQGRVRWTRDAARCKPQLHPSPYVADNTGSVSTNQ